MINKRMVPFAIVGLFLGIFVGITVHNLWQSNQENPGETDLLFRRALKAGDLAPDFTLPSLDGNQVRFEEFQGTAVLLNFWASWCGPCRLEMPAIQERFNTHAPELAVLAVNIGESADTARNFSDELGLTFPVVLDEGGLVQKEYTVNALPVTFFIDEKGYVRARHVGILSESLLDKYLVEIGVGID